MTEPSTLIDALQPTIEVDAVCAAAIDLALAAARETAGDEVGTHLGVVGEGERLVTHRIESLLAGYSGWYWAVTVGRAVDHEPTVTEVVLLPGKDAILAKPWVPWSERLQAGDLSPGDLLPAPEDDVRLVPAYVQSDDEQVGEVAFELGLGRVRVLSRLGRLEAADRWLAGDGGPDTTMARMAPAHCGTCGFFVSVAGSLKAAVGVCANEFTETDGRIVSVEHGCGAHSEASAGQVNQEQALGERGVVYDDDAIDPLSLRDAPPLDDELLDDELLDDELPNDELLNDELLDDELLDDEPGSQESTVVSHDRPAAPEEPTIAVTPDVLQDLGVDVSED